MIKTKVSPSILSADFSIMKEEIQKIENSGADYVHCDVMDGVFVKNITFGMKMIQDIKKHTTLPLDVHLMIVNAQNYVEQFALCGADIITVHYEGCKDNLKEVLQKIKSCGKKCGVALNPNSPVSAIEEEIPLCDLVLIMSVYPGFGGQEFMGEVLQKAEQIRAISKTVEIEIDGGVSLANCQEIKKAGVNVLVAGSSFFNATDKKAFVQQIKG